jgi:hypothetical protein
MKDTKSKKQEETKTMLANMMKMMEMNTSVNM